MLSHLRLLLSKFYSKQESAIVGKQAMPKFSEYTAVSTPDASDGKISGTYIAPNNGYFVIAAKSGTNSMCNVWGTAFDTGCAGSTEAQCKVFTPVVKGGYVWYIVKPELHLARFYPLVGGGE